MENLNVEGRFQYLRVRCPQCFRMYSVNPKEIREAKPRFACVACQSQFWLAFPECLQHPEVIGFPISWLKPQLDFAPSPEAKEEQKDCPKCRAQVAMSAKECTSCGLIFDKYKATRVVESGPHASQRLREAWEQIIADFDNEERHQGFIKACQSEDNLSYALYRYSNFLEAQPMDRLARRMRESAKALLETKVEMPRPPVRGRPQGWWPVNALMVMVSISLLIWGFVMPEFRNMMGFGATLLFMSLALQFYGPSR